MLWLHGRGRVELRWGDQLSRAAIIGALVLGSWLASGCASAPPDPERYRLTGSASWREGARGDPVLLDLQPRYPVFFAVALDPIKTQELDIRKLRSDLESGTGRQRFDALNAVAIAYFELNFRAQDGLESDTGGGSYLADSFRATKLLSVPWRAYREIEDPLVREAILDFYTDIVHGEKPHAADTAPRLVRLVRSLEKKETDPARRERIRALGDELVAMEAALRNASAQ